MPYMIGIGEATNTLLTFIPVTLMIISGYAVGTMIFKARKVSAIFLRDFIYGNIVLQFMFISGFIVFGVLTTAVKEFFTAFTYILAGLTILGAYFLLRKLIVYVTSSHTIISHIVHSHNVVARNTKRLHDSNHQTIFITFGIALVATLLVYQAIIIYYHPIYSEYDSLYLFLPVSKSILLGNGLNHDFYLGSDANMRFPPLVQAINAWLLHSFEYSSIRMFPIYYVFFATILVYYLTRNILSKISNGDSSFFGVIASSAFLITPAILVTSSRFSLQQDIAFIFFITASFYFLSEIVRYDKPAKTNLLMLSTSLALMILTREIGLVMSIAIFFMVPAIKYTQHNLKLRFLFTILSLLPFYFYYLAFYSSYPINSGLIMVVLSNLAIFYLVSKIKYQNKISMLIRSGTSFIYVIPLIIPAIFIATNMIISNGLYPAITFSDKFYDTNALWLEAFTQPKDRHLELLDEIEGLLRIDILFIGTAMGGIFIIFKLVGLGKIIYLLKGNSQYSLIIILMIFLLIAWASVLQSGFKTSDIRHVAYFVPLLSILLVIGMKTSRDSPTYWKIYCYSVIVFSTFYFLSISIHTSNYNEKFEGFSVDPFKSPIITKLDLALGIMLSTPLLIIGMIKLKKSSSTKKKFKLPKFPLAFVVAILSALLIMQIYIFSLSEINISPRQRLDLQSPPGWETNIFEVINYLNSSEKGNVLAIRAPAIPFFTNRTSFDLFNPQSFAYSISDLILSKNSTIFKQSLSEMGIRYIVIPNERSSLYYAVQNLMKKSQFVQIVNTDNTFERIDFKNFNIYKYNPASANRIDLIDKNHIWKPFGKTKVEQNKNNLTISIDADEKGKIYNRAYLQTRLDIATRPLLLALDYEVKTNKGNATFAAEIRDNASSRILFSSMLSNNTGNLTDRTFILPKDIVGGKQYEFRLYVISQGTGQHDLIVKKLSLLYT